MYLPLTTILILCDSQLQADCMSLLKGQNANMLSQGGVYELLHLPTVSSQTATAKEEILLYASEVSDFLCSHILCHMIILTIC